MSKDFDLLVYLAEKSGLYNRLKTSTVKIAKETNTSQQTVSRKLRQLEADRLITRSVSARGMEITLANDGKNLLKENYTVLKSIFENKRPPLEGFVSRGIGEGAYYVLKYKKLFKESLGFAPYPGTLNLKVDQGKALAFLDSLDKIHVKGFKDKTRSFGSLDCYTLKLRGLEAAIIIPERSRHGDNIVEIIAPVHLRTKLKLKDNTRLEVKK